MYLLSYPWVNRNFWFGLVCFDAFWFWFAMFCFVLVWFVLVCVLVWFGFCFHFILCLFLFSFSFVFWFCLWCFCFCLCFCCIVLFLNPFHCFNLRVCLCLSIKHLPLWYFANSEAYIFKFDLSIQMLYDVQVVQPSAVFCLFFWVNLREYGGFVLEM